MEPLISEAALPPLYAGWMAALLQGPIPDETRATCGDCAMRPRAESDEIGRGFFHPLVRCCTYVPGLSNFLVGRVLRETDPAGEFGRETLRARIRNGDAVTPLGVDSPRRYRLLYGGGRGFGQSEALRCPHLVEESGHCGIWRHRNSVCTTWFCKHNRGAVGEQFWRELQRLLTAIEAELGWWCVMELDPGPGVTGTLLGMAGRGGNGAPLSADEVDGVGSVELLRAVWGSWLGREETFYQECARLVEALSWADVLQLCGPEMRARARAVHQAYRRLMSDDVPTRLKPGPFTIIESTPARATVNTYRQYDPLSLPQVLLSALPHFDGRPTEEVLQTLVEERKLRVAPELVRKLVDYQVLVPAPDPADG